MLSTKDRLKENVDLWNLFTNTDEYFSLRTDDHGRCTFSDGGRGTISDPHVSRFLIGNGFRPDYPDGRKFALCLTHDVDDIYPPFLHTLASILHCTRGRNFGGLFRHMVWPLRGKADSPYRKFNKIMNLENKYGAKSSFYFMATRKDPVRSRYDVEDLTKELRHIHDNGWDVGLHTGYYSFDDLGEITREKERIEHALGKPISGCRNHYLRFIVPDTWELLADAGFGYDATFGYADMIGFRNGMCHPFRPFNLNSGKDVEIFEIPLNVMDTTLFQYMHLDMDQARSILREMIDTVEALQGVLTVLWHSEVFGSSYRQDWVKLYEWLLQYAYEKGAWLASADQIYQRLSANQREASNVPQRHRSTRLPVGE